MTKIENQALTLTADIKPVSLISIPDIKRLIMPVSGCQDLETIKITNGEDQESPAIASMRQILTRAMEDSQIINRLASCKMDTNFSQVEIAQVFDIDNGQHNLLERLYHILNHNIDPEIVIDILTPFVTTKGCSLESLAILKTNQKLLTEFINLISGTKFKKEFYYKIQPSSEPYEPDTKSKIENLIKNWLNEVSANTSLPNKETALINQALRDFFNLDNHFYPDQPETGGLIMTAFKDLTSKTYFAKRKYSDQQPIGWEYLYSYEPFKTHLFRYAHAVEKGKYLIYSFQEMKHLYKTFFPEIFLEADISGLVLKEPKNSDYQANRHEVYQGSNGSFSSDNHLIKLYTSQYLDNGTADEIAKQQTYDLNGQTKVNRRVLDLLILSHEYTHAIYNDLTCAYELYSEMPDYNDTADHAINEGFAVLMELLMADMLVFNQSILNFSEQNVNEINLLKQQRLYRLKKQKNGYTEGAFKILHKIFLSRAGRGKTRNVHEGLIAVKEFITKIDSAKTARLSRKDPVYLKALKEADLEKIRFLVS